MMGRGTGQMGRWGAEHGSMMGRGTGQMERWGAEHGSMMGLGTVQMGRWGAEHGSMMGRGTGQMGCWGVEHGNTSHLAQNEWRMPLRPLWNRNMDQTLVGLGTWGDPRLMVTSRTSSSSISWYAHHTGSSPSEQVQNLEETIRRLQEENAQMRSRFERDMQVQLQQEVERQVQEHTQQRELEANAREQAREREWQQREFDVLLSDTPIGIRSFARTEEVIVSAPVQECLDMEVDKVEGDAKLTALKKPNRRKKRRSKNKLLAKGEGTENPNTSVGAIASADQEMIMQSPAANGDGKSSISSTNALDLISSQDICSPAATVDGKSSFTNTNATDLIASGDILSTKVHEAVSGETGSGKTVTDSTTSKKRKRNRRAKKKVAGDVSSAKVDEIVSGETVPDKAVTNNTTPKKRKRNKKKKKVAGDVLSAKVNEVSGETVPSKTSTNNTTPKMKKRNKKKRKLKTVAGDILSTCENIQGKVKEIDGSSATEVTEAISGEMVSGKTSPTKAISGDWDQFLKQKSPLSGDIPNTDWNPWPKGADIVSKGAHILNTDRKLKTVAGDILSTCETIQGKVNAIDGSSATEVTEAISGEMVSGKTALTESISGDWDPLEKKKSPLAGDIPNTDWNPWPKGADFVLKGAHILNTDQKQLSKKKSPLLGYILNTDWKCGKNMVPELREKGIYMNEEKFGTYKWDGYAGEYDISGTKGKECGWIYE
nr:FCP1-like domain, HAD-like domain protein [Tanacetum cinerariifolium]